MKGSCYFHENEVILDYSAEFIETSTQLVNSDFFNTFLDQYLNHLETSRRDLHDFLYAGGRTRFQVREDLKNSIKLLMFMNMDRGNMRYIQFPDQFLERLLYWASIPTAHFPAVGLRGAAARAPDAAL